MNGERLKKLRLRKGLSQKAVADFLQIDRTTYLKYESGTSNPNVTRLARLAEFLGVTPDYLLCEDVAPATEKTDSNIDELLSLYERMDDKFKMRLLGAAYAILAEQNLNAGIHLGATSVPTK